jgi:hypothetical protein
LWKRVVKSSNRCFKDLTQSLHGSDHVCKPFNLESPQSMIIWRWISVTNRTKNVKITWWCSPPLMSSTSCSFSFLNSNNHHNFWLFFDLQLIVIIHNKNYLLIWIATQFKVSKNLLKSINNWRLRQTNRKINNECHKIVGNPLWRWN